MLRTRLMLGLMCLLIILLSMGLYSIDRCSQLGWRIQDINQSSEQFWKHLSRLKRSGAAMTGALVLRTTNAPSQALSDFRAASRNFGQALGDEAKREDASPEEREILEKLSKNFRNYIERAEAYLSTPDQSPAESKAIASRLGTDIASILNLVDKMEVAHQDSMRQGRKSAAAEINNTIRSMILLMIAATVVAIYAFLRLTRSLLDPLTYLTTSIRQVGEGNLDQTVPVLSDDELGTLATSFNRMSAQLKQYRESTSGELLRLNMTIRATLASFPDPIFVLNSQGAVEFRNPEADQLAVKLLFSGVTRLPKKVDEKVEEVRASGKDYFPTSFKEAIKFHIDGFDRYFLPRIVLLRDEKRETFGVAVILEDVTRMLLLDDVKSNLISTVSHELKTPLTSVRMALYLLVEKTVGPLNDKQEDLVKTARSDADRLLKTLNDLLDLARLEQGPAPLQLSLISPTELINTAVRETQPVAQSASITLRTEIAPDLPQLDVDPQRLAYVFANLITNAIKYSPNGKEIVIRAAAGQLRSKAPGIRFSVQDRGAGIPTEYQEHIFERFYRIPGTSKSGAGLGLSIAREIVVAHKGEIGVISKPEQGSEFFFVLPVTTVEAK